MNKHHPLCFLLLAAILLPASCTTPRRDGTGRIVEDGTGRKVELPARIERIVGLRPGALRLLAYMETTDLVAGIEQVETTGADRPYMVAHPELLERPFIGPRGGDNERILHVRPDLIFLTYASAGEADALAEKTGIPVVALQYPEIGTDPQQLYASLQIIGQVLHKEDRADSLVAYIQQTIRDLDNRTRHIPADRKPSAYIGGIAHGRARNLTSTHPDYPPFVFTHAHNVAAGIDRSRISSLAGAYVDIEQLLLWDPDVIFVDQAGLLLAQQDLKLAGNLAAVKNRRIYTLPTYNSYAVNYETALINSWYVGRILYPAAFADIVPEEKADEILEQFLGKRLPPRSLTPGSFQPLQLPE
ncbi:MAG: iron ABC transporter substrate-binding protein [Tannerellaceae bacterium]|jgi:iron complex transport system substrate-binding protein|nr:iron ABC transporter substrate-binding protein [Tannerellaceae bacterium]